MGMVLDMAHIKLLVYCRIWAKIVEKTLLNSAQKKKEEKFGPRKN